MKTFEEFMRLKEAPMADYQGQQHAGHLGADSDFAEPADPTHPMQQHRMVNPGTDDSMEDAFANPELYPKMFADLYQRVSALEKGA